MVLYIVLSIYYKIEDYAYRKKRRHTHYCKTTGRVI